MYEQLQSYIRARMAESDQIDPARREMLSRFADYLRAGAERHDGAPSLLFVCTHNSRRSQMAQIWAQCAAEYFGLGAVRAYSGGTEVTAFNVRAVSAIAQAGFHVEDPGGDNPRYLVSFSAEGSPVACFSKLYDDPFNPQSHFAAVMTCSEADENCPYIPGAEFRLSLTYEDPKVADGTPQEAERYAERARQIAREILFAFSLVPHQ